MAAVVGAVAVFEAAVVAGELQGGSHFLIRERPVAELIVQIVRAVLQEDAERFVLGLANLFRINVSATDVGKATDVAEDFAKRVGPFPGDGESANAAAGNAAD